MFLSGIKRAQSRDECRPSRVVAFISVLAAVIGTVIFFLRIGEVGVLVSLADSMLLASLLPLATSAFALIYREGGFDIFIFAFERLFVRRAREEKDSYYEFCKRPRGRSEIARPLALIGFSLFLFSLVVSLL